MVEWHPQHEPCRNVLANEVSCLPIHVLLEYYTVSTRLPAPNRISAPDAASVLGLLDRELISLPAHEQFDFVGVLAERGLRARATYDARRVPHSFV